MIAVNSIEIPERFVTVASKWYGGQGCMLYAVASTGGLTTGTIRPRDDDGNPVSDEQWYCDLWSGLSSDVGYARKVCRDLLEGCADRADDLEGCTDEEVELRFNDYDDAVADFDNLSDFETWIDNVVLPGLEES